MILDEKTNGNRKIMDEKTNGILDDFGIVADFQVPFFRWMVNFGVPNFRTDPML